MKRDRELIEVSDDEWSLHSDSFKPSRVFKPTPSSGNPPPPIESFAYNPKPIHVIDSSSSSEENGNVGFRSGNEFEGLEDDDADMEIGKGAATSNRGNRFVISDDEDDPVEFSFSFSDEDDDVGEEVEEEEDVVKKALRKCEKISAELKRELYGTTSEVCDRYSEVELGASSSVRIVTQNDVNEVCGSGDSDFKPILKPYQLVGVNFLLLLYRKKIGGAILADEMGLASVLENWERELNKWCPSFTVLQYHGSARSAHSKELNSLGKAGLPPPFDVILVCYSLFERHSVQQKDDRKILRHWKWGCVLMDEAHALKDKNSYRWKNLMSVARNARQRLMLTGTPLQNDLHELWSMLEFMMPDLFETGDVDLKKLLNAEDRDLISRMKSILGPFILRRLKSDVMQQLVPKTQKIEYVLMGKQQEDAYQEAIENYRIASQSRVTRSSETSLRNIASILPRRQISNYFFEFRKIANHPLLVRRIYTDDDIVRFAKMLHPKGVFGFECTLERVIEELRTYNDFSIHRLLLYYGDANVKGILSEEHVMVSGKCRALAELLPVLNQYGHRVLIFSQWTSMLDILEWALDVIGLTYRRLDGSTQVTERQTIVDTFNKDTSIFACLLSTRAGGQGLNLTGADTVVIHDMDFNPQIDRQAEDRCHRIGQTKPVTVYRLVTKNTVDENVYEIAKRKLTLDAAVLESGIQLDNQGDVPDKTMAEILSSMLR
ncbi:protein CHROMATIN REMODELING 19 isoform X2 [Primulina huaijiensis]|uniref:protein CHROMATIN REMODELING 19 isoform X2 n=1 Tax=Primulina huaijiensis TaxID=1492673 RepID=UPI003CC790AB